MSAARSIVARMDIILIPGLWLDGSSWAEVSADLERAGHTVHPLTMPGVGASADASADIGIADWVAHAVAAVDDVGRPVVVVGHSGGGNVAWGVADARADRIRRVVLVDTVAPPSGFSISEFEIVDGVIPFPGWDHFPAEDVDDVDDATRTRTLALTHSVPARVPTDPIEFTTGDRHRVPVTMLMGGLDQQTLESELDEWGPYADEYRAIDAVEVVRVGSGHWPQFSVPARLAQLIHDAASRGA
jgi:pimeloyl-ACP methyl ester carboxylesterase